MSDITAERAVLDKITPQGVLNAAWQAFVIEDRPPAMAANGACKYLTPDGRKCAVGLCIPDGHPGQQCDGAVCDLQRRHPDLFLNDITQEEVHLLGKMQDDLHDALVDKLNTTEWRQSVNLREEYLTFAEEHDLTVPQDPSEMEA